MDKFTCADIYSKIGRDDRCATITFSKESEIGRLVGFLTGKCVYSQKERKALEEDEHAFDNQNLVRFKIVMPAEGFDVNQIIQIKPDEIVELTYIPKGALEETLNKFYSDALRSLSRIVVPYRIEDAQTELGVQYGFMGGLLSKGIAITEDEYSEYLACKLILNEEISDNESDVIGGVGLQMKNQKVLYHLLRWKCWLGEIEAQESKRLVEMELAEKKSRLEKVEKQLNDMGSSMRKLEKENPDLLNFLIEKVLDFKEHRLNQGESIIYADVDTFIHVCFRHAKEYIVGNQFVDRSKFQLEEKDIFTVLQQVVAMIENEYVAYRMDNPNTRFFRKGDKSLYLLGDYYAIDILPDGRVSTFYKEVLSK